MRNLRVGVVLTLATVTLGLGAAPTQAAAPPATKRHITDPRLEHEIRKAEAKRQRTNGRGAAPLVLAEVLTADTAAVAKRTRALGGQVDGVVDGALVQVRVPVTTIDTLAALPAIIDMEYPQRSGYVPVSPRTHLLARPQATDTGVVQSEVGLTNMSLWRNAGFTGAGAKVGIVDYFDLTLWDPVEHGTQPDAAHQFCKDSLNQGLCAFDGTIASGGAAGNEAFVHGVAVSEIVHDMAPDAELYIASVGTTADLQAAVNWFASKGVTVMNRSLGSAYDGPGDGTGPLAGVVNSAVAKGITWFNSAGNDGDGTYLRRVLSRTVVANGGNYVNFNDGRRNISPNPDTWLRVISNGCFFMDGVRWANDWNVPAAQRTDYAVEFWEPRAGFNVGSLGGHTNPTSTAQVQPINLNNTQFGYQGGTGSGQNVANRQQRSGAAPLEADDIAVCPTRLQLDGYSTTYIRIKRNAATPVGAAADRVEVAIAGDAILENGLSDRAGSAAKPVVDSRNPGLVSVGALEVDPTLQLDAAHGDRIAYYSSQGPTSDGRVKPDISSWAGFPSSTYNQPFSGTSAASPTVAGAAAVLKAAGLAATPAALAALLQQSVLDRGPGGFDNAYGAGQLQLPATPPAAATPTNAVFVPVGAPTRILDTRSGRPMRPNSVVNVVPPPFTFTPANVTAVVVNITSIGSVGRGGVQAVPYLRDSLGATATMTVNRAGWSTPGLAIVPIGANGAISLYNTAGGHLVVDLVGYFAADPTRLSGGSGRFVPLAAPTRAGKAVITGTGATTVPATVESTTGWLVVSVTASNPSSGGTARVYGSVSGPNAQLFSNLHYAAGENTTATAIVPAQNGTIGVWAANDVAGGQVTLYVDVIGTISNDTAATTLAGTFLTAPARRVAAGTFSAGQRQTFTVAGDAARFPLPTGNVPSSVLAVTGVVTATGATVRGYGNLAAAPVPVAATAQFSMVAGGTTALTTLVGVSPGPTDDTVDVFTSQAGRVILDVTGWFTTGA